MWNDHYSKLFNCVKGDTHKSDVLDAINLVSDDCDMFNQNDVKSAIASLCANKASIIRKSGNPHFACYML